VRKGSGFCLDAGFPFRRLIYVIELSKAELDAMLEEAIIDCNDEEEQLTGIVTMVENNLAVPFETTTLGVTITVTGMTQTSHGLMADCARGGARG
jgi:hypothetical protein